MGTMDGCALKSSPCNFPVADSKQDQLVVLLAPIQRDGELVCRWEKRQGGQPIGAPQRTCHARVGPGVAGGQIAELDTAARLAFHGQELSVRGKLERSAPGKPADQDLTLQIQYDHASLAMGRFPMDAKRIPQATASRSAEVNTRPSTTISTIPGPREGRRFCNSAARMGKSDWSAPVATSHSRTFVALVLTVATNRLSGEKAIGA